MSAVPLKFDFSRLTPASMVVLCGTVLMLAALSAVLMIGATTAVLCLAALFVLVGITVFALAARDAWMS